MSDDRAALPRSGEGPSESGAAGAAATSPIAMCLRLAAAGLAIGVAAVMVAVVPHSGRWWVGVSIVVSLLVALLGGRLGAFAPWGLAASAVGVMLAADGNRLSVPTAAVIGLLLLGYLVLVEFAESLGSEATDARLAALVGWLRSVNPVIAAGIAGAVAVAVVVVLPVPPLTFVVLLAPVALVAGVLLTVGRRYGAK